MIASAPDARCSATRRAACSASNAARRLVTSSTAGVEAVGTPGFKHNRHRVGYCGMRPGDSFWRQPAALPRRLGPPGVLRVSPVDAVEHVAELGCRDRHHALGRRRPHEPAALQTLDIQRHADPVVPKDLHQVAAIAPENVEVACMRVAL